MTVREARPDDWATIAALRSEWKPGSPADEERFIDEFREWARRHAATHTGFIAERDGSVVGCAWLAVTARVPASGRLDRRTGDLQSVYVTPDARGSGHGHALVRAVLDRAWDSGLERLVVHSSVEAVEFYRRLGFASSDILLDVALR